MPNLSRETIENFRKGEVSLSEVFQIDAKQIAALLMTGHAMLNEGRLQEAKNIFEGLAVLDRRNPYVYAVLGSLYQKVENLDLAVGMYSTAISIFPADINSLANRGEIYLKQGKFQQAATDFSRAIELDPDRKHPAANRARFLAAITGEALAVAKENGIEALEQTKQLIGR